MLDGAGGERKKEKRGSERGRDIFAAAAAAGRSRDESGREEEEEDAHATRREGNDRRLLQGCHLIRELVRRLATPPRGSSHASERFSSFVTRERKRPRLAPFPFQRVWESRTHDDKPKIKNEAFLISSFIRIFDTCAFCLPSPSFL